MLSPKSWSRFCRAVRRPGPAMSWRKRVRREPRERWERASSSAARRCKVKGALYDQGKPCEPEANAAKLLASQTAVRTCQTAILTHGGFGYAKEFHVERFLGKR
jgi:alkylation response protein AidB-like acyl-CoA dehydrogenase